MSETDCFRRGGHFKPSNFNTNWFKKENYLGELRKPNIKDKTHKSKKLTKPNDETIPRAITADILSYAKIQEGMLILGCIRSVTDITVNVELPGKTFGKIDITSISKLFRKRLEKFASSQTADDEEGIESLKDIFIVGQFIPTKVVESKQTEKGMKVSLSMDPASIHYNYNHRSFDSEHLIWASVLEKSDHGYLLDVGVKNVRIILPFENIDAGKEYVDGEPLWCVVEKAIKTKEAVTLIVTAITNLINSNTVHDCSLDNIIPGMCVDLCVDKILKDGLEGKFLGMYPGFINDIYLEKPFKSKDIYDGQIVKAWVLYTQPMTKTTHLTMRNLDQVPPPRFANGHILRAKVASKTSKGLILNLSSSEKGFVTHKRLFKSLKLNVKSDLDEIIRRSYGLNSSHQCRILDYVHMDRMYVCTFEQDVLKEAVFTMKDVKVGAFVNVEIIEINKSGIVVKMGNFNGFVTNEHLCDVSYSEAMKRQFTVGQRISARIWNIENGSSIKLTLKKLLMDAEECLKSYDEVIKNAQYLGVVVKVTKQGALIKFFGGVQGWLKRMDDDDDNPNKDFSRMFYIGQVILTTVLNVEKNRITLTLDPPKLSSHKQLRIGQVVSGVVDSINMEGITVTVGPRKIKCILPTFHLCESYSLAKDILKTYCCGDEIHNLICISNTDAQVVSIREYNQYKTYNFPKLSDLRLGSTISCSVKETNTAGLFLTSPIRYFNGEIFVAREDVIDGEDLFHALKFKTDQSIICKITEMDKEKKHIAGSAKLSEVFNYDLEYTVKKFHQYLSDILRIKSSLIDLENPLATFAIGAHTTCTIRNVCCEGCVVTLPNGVEGLVEVDQYPKKAVQIGQSMRGVVLWIDYVNKYVLLSLKGLIVDKVNKIQDLRTNLKCGQSTFADILHVRKEFVICLLGREANRQLAFIPMQLHENDFVPSVKYYELLKNKKIKFKIFSLNNNVIVGFEKMYVKRISKQAKKFSLQNKIHDKNTPRKNDSINGAQVQSKPTVQESHNLKVSRNRTQGSNNSKCREEEMKIDSSYDTEDDDSHIGNESGEPWEDISTKYSASERSDMSDGDTSNNSEKSDRSLHEDSEIDNGTGHASEEEVTKFKKAEKTNDQFSDNTDVSDEDEHNDKSIARSDESQEISEDEKITTTKTSSVKRTNIDDFFDNADVSDGCDEHDDKSETHGDESQEISEDDERITTKMSSVKRKSNDDEENVVKKIRFSTEHDIRKFRDLDIIEVPKMNLQAVLPGVMNFFDCDDKMEVKCKVNELPEVQSSNFKKKKLTPAEQADFLLQEENLLRSKEEDLANIKRVPQSAEEFDRRLLAEPDSSELWCQYTAFLLQTNEVIKARAIAKKALMSIRQTAIQDRLNIWIMYMNLENINGTKETFDEVFEEAVRCNDALTVYLAALQILSANPNLQHLEEKIMKTRAKFKQEQKMYLAIAKIYYNQKRFSEARKLKDDGLRNIINIKHIPFIVQFAIMEMNLGEESHGESLFETVLQSDPKRIDVWFTYVDQLVKKGKLDLARRVLERAVTQKLSHKKMSTLFKKFEEFEDKHGNAETKTNLSKLLANYLSSFNNKEN